MSRLLPNCLAQYRSPAVNGLARRGLFSLLQGLRSGRLHLIDASGSYLFGDHRSSLCATVRIHRAQTYQRLLWGGSIGAAEAYVDGWWDCDDLTGLIRIFTANMAVLEEMENGLTALLRLFSRVRHLVRRNSRRGARENIIAHYDLGNALYASFLDSKMMYSSAIFPTPQTSLEEASEYKLEVICRKLRLQPGDHLLEIGSGWGGLAIHAASRYHCRVTTTTISPAQYQEAARRIDAAGLTDRITLLLRDYRDLDGHYDKLVSVEMIEAVGDAYLPAFFKKCGELLNNSGTMLLQAITIRDQQYAAYRRDVDFIQRHIFPGGCVPSLTRMLNLLTSQTSLTVRHLEDYGLDYARTLELWRQRFTAAAPVLAEKGYDQRFQRLWRFYLSYCEGGFRERAISLVHLLADRGGTGKPV